MKKQELTERQRAFCKNYAHKESDTFGNATQSYIKAGYKNTRASRQAACTMLTKRNIKKEISRIKQEIEEKEEFRIEWLDQKLREFHERCIDKHDLTNEKGALQLIGQRLAAYTDKQQVNAQTEAIDGMNPAERQALTDLARSYKVQLTKPAAKTG